MFSQQQKMKALRFQNLIYAKVRESILEYGLHSVLDIGCGCPQKLKAYIFPVSTDVTGIDMLEVEDFDEYDMTYHKEDLNKSKLDLEKTFDVIICADVIEHISMLHNLLALIKRHMSNNTILAISTPDASSYHMVEQNAGHVHFWNKDEFIDLLKSFGFNVLSSMVEEERFGSNAEAHYNSNICFCKIKN